ncbi:MAG: sigma-54-dependent Fis family transcriptional regulator [Syntrophaceae bacterium]|nr:sigma-54-dependent Fis family transcriptional regulator [Syntrophaceae bacterium]
MKESILVVDDVPDMLKFLERLIQEELHVDVVALDDAEKAMEKVLKDPPSIVLADIRMPKMNGVELLRRIKEMDHSPLVIMMTAYGSIEDAVESLKLGAYDYITKPFDEERLLHTLKKALEHHDLVKKNIDLEKRVKEKEALNGFIGESLPIRRLVETIKIVAKTDLTVLITGETGTGKDLAARMIHALSHRSNKPFIPVNCPTIPETILESELFGYKKGAFTGAAQDKMGLFGTADGGTLLLDEIGDLPTMLQAKLLRVLEEKEIKPLGDTKTNKIDVRVIASTNQDLKEKIASHQFREDLYHRLNVVSISTPSLKEIAEDIPLIANHFLSFYCSEFNIAQKRFSEDTLRMFISRRWTGNVRELQNEIKRAVIFSKGEMITPEDFQNETRLPYPEENADSLLKLTYKEARKNLLEKFNVQYIRDLLDKYSGNVSLAARMAGLERQSLQHLIKRYGIHPEEFRKSANKM